MNGEGHSRDRGSYVQAMEVWRGACVQESVVSSAAAADVGCVGHARDGSGEMGPETMTLGLWEG